MRVGALAGREVALLDDERVAGAAVLRVVVVEVLRVAGAEVLRVTGAAVERVAVAVVLREALEAVAVRLVVAVAVREPVVAAVRLVVAVAVREPAAAVAEALREPCEAVAAPRLEVDVVATRVFCEPKVRSTDALRVAVPAADAVREPVAAVRVGCKSRALETARPEALTAEALRLAKERSG